MVKKIPFLSIILISLLFLNVREIFGSSAGTVNSLGGRRIIKRLPNAGKARDVPLLHSVYLDLRPGQLD